MKRPRRIGRRIVRAFILMVLLWVAVSALVTWRLSRRVSFRSVETMPEIPGSVIEQQRLKTTDGQEIGAWLVKGREDRPNVVVLHGLGDSRTGMAPLIQSLAEDGYGVLAITMRSSGDSTGDVNDVGWSARHDVIAAVEFLERQQAGRRIYICGTSMGAAAAVYAARDLGTRVSGYVLDSPYRDLKTAVWNRVNLYLLPGLDWAAYAGLRLWAPVFFKASLDELSPVTRVKDIPQSVPILILAGAIDRLATLQEAEDISHAAGDHVRVVIFHESDHSMLFRTEPDRYRRELNDFIK